MDAPDQRRSRTPAVKRITVPRNLEQACHEFNTHRFFECHETLEEVWQEEAGEVRDLYKGLIQVAAAYVHITRGNATGAERLLRTALGYLAPYRAGGAMGFEVEAICAVAEDAYGRVLAFAPGRYTGLSLEDVPIPVFRCELTALPAEARHWRAWGFDAEGNEREMEIPAGD